MRYLTLVFGFSDPEKASAFTQTINTWCKVAQDPFNPTIVRVRIKEEEIPTVKEHTTRLGGKKL